MSPTPEEQPFGVARRRLERRPAVPRDQRVLMSSSGPVNWELARQVGIASASWGNEDPAPSEEDRRGFDEAVRVAELQVAGFTGLEAPSDIPKVEAVRRGQWVQANIEGLRALLEPAAAKIGDAIATAQREAVPEQAQAGVAQCSANCRRCSSGHRWAPCSGRSPSRCWVSTTSRCRGPTAPALLFVVPNIGRFEEEWSLDPTDFRTWIAIHEVTTGSSSRGRGRSRGSAS